MARGGTLRKALSDESETLFPIIAVPFRQLRILLHDLAEIFRMIFYPSHPTRSVSRHKLELDPIGLIQGEWRNTFCRTRR